jgi:hypothetical protein
MGSVSNQVSQPPNPESCDVFDFIDSHVCYGGAAQDVCANMDLGETDMAATRIVNWEGVGGTGRIAQVLGDNRPSA